MGNLGEVMMLVVITHIVGQSIQWAIVRICLLALHMSNKGLSCESIDKGDFSIVTYT